MKRDWYDRFITAKERQYFLASDVTATFMLREREVKLTFETVVIDVMHNNIPNWHDYEIRHGILALENLLDQWKARGWMILDEEFTWWKSVQDVHIEHFNRRRISYVYGSTYQSLMEVKHE